MFAQRAWRFFTTKPLLWILLLALVLRLAGLLLFPHYFDFVATGRVLGINSYDILAQNLINTGVYGFEPGVPDAVLPPLYSSVIAALYILFDRSFIPMISLHILLDLVAIALLYAIVRELFRENRWVAAIASLLFAAYPYLIFQSFTFIDTSLFVTGLHLWLWLLIGLRGAHTNRRMVMFSLIWGIVTSALILTRPNIVVLFPFAIVWLVSQHSWRGAAMKVGPAMMIAAILLIPWVSRNHSLYQRTVFVSVNAGMNFLHGNNPCTLDFLQRGYSPQWSLPDEYYDAVESGNAAAKDALMFQEGIDFLRVNPQVIPTLYWAKFRAHWSGDLFPSQNPPGTADSIYLESICTPAEYEAQTVQEADPVRLYDEAPEAGLFRTIHRWYFGPLLLLAIWGLWLSRREWRRVSILWAVQISMTIVYVVFHPATRYRAPTDPLLFVFSAVALCWLWERAEERGWLLWLPSTLKHNS
ncbi:MAG: glycosyltransferase family 39 protein [Anaerolineaceae bacterium]|nr:glycosyltransferase family 39 protein [Anaerolineaceae bacterium]